MTTVYNITAGLSKVIDNHRDNISRQLIRALLIHHRPVQKSEPQMCINKKS